MPRNHSLLVGVAVCSLSFAVLGLNANAQEKSDASSQEKFPGTQLLKMEGDIASQLVDGVDKFLLREIELSVQRRAKYWQRDTSSPEALAKSVEKNRQRLAHILGVRDARVPFEGIELVGSTAEPALVGNGAGFKVYSVRWSSVRDMHGEGLLLVPDHGKPVANVIAVPDADQTPEMIAGLVEGVPTNSQFARRLAESGCRVLVPVLINRELKMRSGRATLTSREFLYRPAFELGRHLIGFEVQKILAGVDWFTKEAGDRNPNIGVFGYGEGGMLALYAAALDDRIDAVGVSGFFGSRQSIWQQPIDRNVFGLLEQFGDAELASLVAPRQVIVEPSKGPELELPSKGGAPAKLTSPSAAEVQAEAARANELLAGLKPTWTVQISGSPEQPAEFGSAAALASFLTALDPAMKLATAGGKTEHARKSFDPNPRHERQMHEIDVHNQWLLSESPYVRDEFMKDLDTSSLEKYTASVEKYRDIFRNEVVGRIEYDLMSPNPRTRRCDKRYDHPKWTAYEVVLDVFPDVFAYGVLLVPKGIAEGEKRPVVVCQHGLEGRPEHVIIGDQGAYHDFAAKLAERGFITFAPQNLYIFQDRFRTLQRKANPVKKTLFSVIVPQHQQIVNWLKTLPQVDSSRIAFYGLSYGGKSAMRIPPLVTDYCLSICSADFNEWVWKNASSRAKYSYVWTGEYEIFEFDLGSTFNYAEMAALIAPRPFMVERGHTDGVSSDEYVSFEFAKVRYLYSYRLKRPDICEMEVFDGPHTINGKGTYDFLHKHLKWPKP